MPNKTVYSTQRLRTMYVRFGSEITKTTTPLSYGVITNFVSKKQLQTLKKNAKDI